MKSQVSGSISLDLSSLAEGVTEQLQPQLQAIQDTLDTVRSLITAPALSDRETVQVIRSAITTMNGSEQPETVAQAGYLAQVLTGMGYTLVRVGETPEQTGQIPVPSTVAAPQEPTFWDDGTRG